MKKFEVTLTGHYEKTISVYAESPEQVAEKVQIVLFDTDLIDFSDEDFAYGEADIKEADEDGCEEHSAEDEDMGDCMLQKYFTEDFLTGKKARNTGQRDRYYVHDSHQGIVSKEKFLEVACEMNRRKSMAVAADGNMVKKNRKYNPQNILGNILECEECGATFRRRTERGKVVYRCATRIEKGREACKKSPTIEEEWIKTEIGKKVCGGEYDAEIVKKKVDRVLIGKDGGIKILYIE